MENRVVLATFLYSLLLIVLMYESRLSARVLQTLTLAYKVVPTVNAKRVWSTVIPCRQRMTHFLILNSLNIHFFNNIRCLVPSYFLF